MKYFEKLIIIVLGIFLCAGIVQIERTGISPNNSSKKNEVVKNEAHINSFNSGDIQPEKTLLLYGSSEKDILFKDNMDKDLTDMKLTHECAESRSFNYQQLNDYQNIIIVVSDFEEGIGENLEEVEKYVNNGGRVIIGTIPNSTADRYRTFCEKTGIKENDGYVEINGMKFLQELIPGSKGREFIDDSAFNDTAIDVKLDDECRVYIESDGDISGIPMLWQKDYGNGRFIFYNGMSLGGDYYCGIFAGTVSLLKDDFMYPIINAKTVFIDDFPAPQYDSTSDIISKYYNRSIKEFYRDVWWPDMNSAAKRNNILYTGLFVSTYNSIVNPDEFVFENEPMEKYYGNSLLKNNYEIGFHGYNHQPLVGEGYLTAEDGEDYKPWKSEADMEDSIRTLKGYAEQLFPNAHITSYVPPSNYLSSQGRQALKEAVPDLKVISGVYSDPNGKAYVQRFGKGDDGIMNFPRISSGMWYDDSAIFEYMNGLGMYGVFSHFIHPDDILDEERGRGERWEELIDNFNMILNDVSTNYKSIRNLRASDAADAVEVYEDLKVQLDYYDDYIEGRCNDFGGEAFFYLKTDKKPIAENDNCEISRVGEKSDKYYYVKVKSPQFKIQLR